ncbi:MAG TPA: bifunctional hydroxymethylpyrimidine kinase/phosphomethylpyrimidine kinase [Spirochaetota bacterium]|nr:bifunctional hydroxymethylpyrimidine kinase/phosphomethylpyrimidine kinase [Spirochaetota bacterium]
MTIPRVLTIAGSDSGGGAGIQADIKTITVLGGFGMTVITALTAQNTTGVQGVLDIPVEFIERQFDSVLSDIGADAAKTGMLSSSEIIKAVVSKIREYGIDRLVVDPVMVAKGGAHLLRDEARESLMRDLLPLALVATPNVPEATALCGHPIESVDDMKKAARKIRDMGARNVVVKGGHLDGDAIDILFDGKDFHTFSVERVVTGDTHGTGCTYSAAIATALARGEEVYGAVESAKRYITAAIRNSLRLGSGHGPTNHLSPILS